MNKLLFSALTMALTLMFFAPVIAAENEILASLEKDGIQLQQIADNDLGEIRGAALISYQPYPSVTAGFKVHQVNYKGFGSKSDYRSYAYTGFGYSPSEYRYYQYEGGTYIVAGDEWRADDVSGVNQWNYGNSYVKEYHLQVVDPNTGQPSPFAFRESAWNRPISTFRW